MKQNSTRRPTFWLLYLTVVLSALLLSACAISPVQALFGPTDLVTQEMGLADFEQVEVHDAFDVQIGHGDEFRVTVTVDRASLRHLEVMQSGDTLQIGLRRRINTFLFWNNNRTLRAEVTMPTLMGVTARDASRVEVNGFNTNEEVHFEIVDASVLSGDLATGDTWLTAADARKIDLRGARQDITVEATGASHITLQGEGKNAMVKASDASEVDLAEFTLHDATVEARDVSKIIVNADGTLNAEASDASDIVYYGDAKLGTIKTEDASSIEARSK